MPATLLPSLLLWPIPLSKPRLLVGLHMWILHEAFPQKITYSQKNILTTFNYPRAQQHQVFIYWKKYRRENSTLKKKNAHALLSFKGKLTFPSAFILLLPACWYKKLSLFFGENSSSHVASEAVEASLLPTLGSVQEMFHYLHPLFLLPEGGEKAKNIFNNSDTFQPLLRQLFSRQILWISATVEEDPEPLAAASMICRRPKSLFLGYSGSLYLTSPRILYVFCEGFIVHFHLEKSTTLKYTELQFMIDEMDLFFLNH